MVGKADQRDVLPGILGGAGMKTAIARFHNVYGPSARGTAGARRPRRRFAGRWLRPGTKARRRSRSGATEPDAELYVHRGLREGIDMITHFDDLIATPINLGSDEMVSINDLVTYVEDIGGLKLKRKYDLDAPRRGGRSSDNTFIKSVLKWAPPTRLKDGLKPTYKWIEQQYLDRKAGKRTVMDTI